MFSFCGSVVRAPEETFGAVNAVTGTVAKSDVADLLKIVIGCELSLVILC